MIKYIILPGIFILFFQTCYSQKKYINRKVAQKNYEGYLLMQEEKFDSALILFDDAIHDDPEAFFIYQNRALCHLMLKDTLKAIRDLKTNISMEPDNAESMYALGNIYKNLTDSLNSKSLFIKSIENADTSFSQVKLLYMNNFVGHVFESENKFDSALIYYNQVKKYKPEDANSFINSAACYFSMDSLEQFCTDVEKAYILGGAVSCYVLKAFCNGCSELAIEAGRTDTLSNALDSRLVMTTKIPPINEMKFDTPQLISEAESKKIKIWYNKYWQICQPEKGVFYREAFWSKLYNFYGGSFTDFYATGEVYAEGRINRTDNEGNYVRYYKNGNIKTKGQFTNGTPSGKWTYYLENGEPDFLVDFFFDSFTFSILNKENPNYAVNNGTGKFILALDEWDGDQASISGEYENKKRTGEWSYKHGKKIIIFEKYKNGDFRRGFINSQNGRITLFNGTINANLFIPLYINHIRSLYFESAEAISYYPFIKVKL